MIRLQTFDVSNNWIEGPLPSLVGLSALQIFSVDQNAITGSFPPVEGLSNLIAFTAQNNGLSGQVPSLDGLTSLQLVRLRSNQLSGHLPTFPSSVAWHGESTLCPGNAFDQIPDPSWNYATGESPWYRNCSIPDAIFLSGFDS
jgi:hypothetical protein